MGGASRLHERLVSTIDSKIAKIALIFISIIFIRKPSVHYCWSTCNMILYVVFDRTHAWITNSLSSPFPLYKAISFWNKWHTISNCIWVRIRTEHSISYNSWYIIKLHLASSLLSHTHTHTHTTCHTKQHNILLEGMLICTSHTALQTATITCKLTSEMYTEAIYMSRTQI